MDHLQGRTRILHLQYFFKYVLTYSLHLNSFLVTFLHNTICRAKLFCPFLLSFSEFLLNMLFNYHLLYFCTALSLIIMLSYHYYLHKSKTLSQLTQCPFTGTLLLFNPQTLPCQSIANLVRSGNVFGDICWHGSIKDERDATRTSRMCLQTIRTLTDEDEIWKTYGY